jgi:predicted ester cyclase
LILTESQLRDFAARYTNAWCSHIPENVASFFSTDGTLKVNEASPAVGRTAICAVAGSFMSAFPDLHLKMDNLVIKDDRAIYHWTFSGGNSGPGGTGHKVLFSGFESWKFTPDGLIAESLGHFDEAQYQHQLNHGI